MRYSGSTEGVTGQLDVVEGLYTHMISLMYVCMCLHVLSVGSGCEAADYVANTVALVNYSTNETLVGCSLFEIVSHSITMYKLAVILLIVTS